MPGGVVQQNSDVLSNEAKNVFKNTYSGQTSPNHGNRTYNGVTTPEYNKLVDARMKEFNRRNGITKKNKMTGKQARAFACEMWNDKGRIGKYNRGVEKEVVGPGTIGKGKDIAMKQVHAKGVAAVLGALMVLLALAMNEADGTNTALVQDLEGEIGRYRAAFENGHDMSIPASGIADDIAQLFANDSVAAGLYNDLMNAGKDE